MKNINFKEISSKILSSKYLYILLLIGAVLIMIPVNITAKPPESSTGSLDPPEFSLEAQEQKIEEALKSIDGAGEVKVLLSLKGGVKRDLAYEDTDALVVSAGGGTQSAVETRYLYPEYLGALVICEGGDSSQVRLDITHAVSSLTGLGSDKITVTKMK